ncbi:MAG: hypothetical protein ACLSVD_16550 [Eggerthellaceae bacterium]
MTASRADRAACHLARRWRVRVDADVLLTIMQVIVGVIVEAAWAACCSTGTATENPAEIPPSTAVA